MNVCRGVEQVVPARGQLIGWWAFAEISLVTSARENEKLNQKLSSSPAVLPFLVAVKTFCWQRRFQPRVHVTHMDADE